MKAPKTAKQHSMFGCVGAIIIITVISIGILIYAFHSASMPQYDSNSTFNANYAQVNLDRNSLGKQGVNDDLHRHLHQEHTSQLSAQHDPHAINYLTQQQSQQQLQSQQSQQSPQTGNKLELNGNNIESEIVLENPSLGQVNDETHINMNNAGASEEESSVNLQKICQIDGKYISVSTHSDLSSMQITELKDIKIWPLPQEYTLYTKLIPINIPFRFETNQPSNDILIEAIHRYYPLMFQHRVSNDKPNSKNNGANNVAANNEDSFEEYHTRIVNSHKYYYDGVIIDINDKSNDLTMKTDESYELIIPLNNPECHKIFIKAETVYGAMYGLETLTQLIQYHFAMNIYRVNVGYIKDYPQFKHRGVLLDTSRHFHPPNVIKHFLDSLSYAKFNVFHWHAVDEQSFPYPSKKFPNLWNGSYTEYERYSEQDLFDIIKYAQYRGIRVLPEFDTPGHAGSWCKGYPICIKARCRNPSPTLLDPSNKLTFDIIDGVFSEASERFPEKFIHLGADEVIHKCYGDDQNVHAWMNKVGIKNTVGVYEYFFHTAHDIATKYGKRPVAWAETWKNFGSRVPKDTIIHVWMGKKILGDIAKDGYDIIMSAGFYLDHLKEKWFNDRYHNNLYENIRDVSKHKHQILGGEACMWSEKIDLSDLDSTIWPDAAAVSERLWTGDKVMNYKLDQVEPRIKWYRCHLFWRGIGGAPVKHQLVRDAPNGPGSCYAQ